MSLKIQMIDDGLKGAGKDPATARVVYVGGDASDGNAKQLHGGADKVMSAVGIKPVLEAPGTCAPAAIKTSFEEAYTATKGQIDAVWSASDLNAASVIAVLEKNGRKLPVSIRPVVLGVL